MWERFCSLAVGEMPIAKQVHKKKKKKKKWQILALQTPTQVNRLSLGDKTRMLPEKWRNIRTECSHQQRVLIHELTSCQKFCIRSTSHKTLDQPISTVLPVHVSSGGWLEICNLPFFFFFLLTCRNNSRQMNEDCICVVFICVCVYLPYLVFKFPFFYHSKTR